MGLSKLQIESVLWEKGWAEPEFSLVLPADLCRLWWGLYKKVYSLSDVSAALTLTDQTIVRWLSTRETKPPEKTLVNLRKWLETKNMPAFPAAKNAEKPPGEDLKQELAGLPRGPGNDSALIQALKQIMSLGGQLLSGPEAVRERIREKNVQLIFDASNVLNALCSEDARDELGFGENRPRRR